MSNYTSVLLDGFATHRSRWLDARNSGVDKLVISVPAGLAGTFVVEGSDDTSTIVAENAANPSDSDASAASYSDVTADWTFDGSLTVSAAASLMGRYQGSKAFVRVKFTPTSGSGTISVTCYATTVDGDSATPAGSYVSVADHVPGGAELSDSNFELALRAAIVAAYDLCGSPEWDERGVVNVLIPAGVWDLSAMTTSLKFPGSFSRYTPGLVGEGGPGSVVLLMPTDVYPWLELGTNNPSASPTSLNAVSNQRIANLELRPAGGVASRGGILSYSSYRCIFEDVLVRGLGLSGTPKWYECVAFDFPNATGNNHQHLMLKRCISDYNLAGFRFGEQTWSATAIDCQVNGNMVAPVMYEGGAVVTWTGGNSQCGPSAENFWFKDTDQAVHCSGAKYTTGLPSGSGAAFSAPSGQLTTVTSLSGMTGYLRNDTATHKGAWLETSTGQLYRIEEVLSATSCTIRRASGGSATGITYQVRGSSGGQHLYVNGIYHEGGAYALASFCPDYASASNLTVVSCEANNCDVVVEATGCSGKISVTATAAPGGLVGKIRHCESFVTDADVSTVDSDTYSLDGLVARKRGAVYDCRVRSSRYNRALVERGFVFAVDARKASTISKSGTDVTAWTDFIGGVVGARQNAGVAPQYVASDANLGAAAIQLIGGASAGAIAGLTWNLAGKLRTPKSGGTLIVVGRLPDTTPDDTPRIIAMADTACIFKTAWNDAQFMATGNYGIFYSAQLGGQSGTAQLGTNDTNGQVILISSYMKTAAGTAGSCGAGASDTLDYLVNANFGCNGFTEALFTPTTPVMSAPYYDGGTVADLYVSHIAFADRGITATEREALLDLIRAEFNVSKT